MARSEAIILDETVSLCPQTLSEFGFLGSQSGGAE